jgi:hypothetical protein
MEDSGLPGADDGTTRWAWRRAERPSGQARLREQKKIIEGKNPRHFPWRVSPIAVSRTESTSIRLSPGDDTVDVPPTAKQRESLSSDRGNMLWLLALLL